MEKISKHRIHSVPWIFDELRSILFHRAYTLPAQLLASTGLQNLPAVLSHRARLRRFKKKQSELHNSGVQIICRSVASLRVSCVSNIPGRQLRPHQVNN